MAKKFLVKEILVENVKFLRDKLPLHSKFCAVVKSNAYGCGAREVVQIVDDFVDYFAVANSAEAREIQDLTRKPILILCADFDDLDFKDAEVVVYNLSHVAKLKNCNRHFDIHIAIDSGMNRLGVKNLEELAQLLRAIKKVKNLRVKGFLSHISDVENLDRCNEQLKKFLAFTKKEKGIIHIASSNFLNLETNFALDMVRFGLALYSNGKNEPMRITAKILQVKEVAFGEFIGYGSGVCAKEKMRVAIINIGYADGFLRRNVGGYVLINDKKCKVLGVCMSLTIVELKGVKCSVGGEAVVLGKDKTKAIFSHERALICDTIPYEILTSFSKLPTNLLE